MGEVWRATHRMLARPAAIKLIKPEILGAPARKRAARRPAVPARGGGGVVLQSPHTIRLYDFGETRAGTFYFVMELLDGLDLETLVRRHGPAAARAGGAPAPAGLPLAGRGARARADPSRRQARQHLSLPPRPRVRLRQGARLRAGEVRSGRIDPRHHQGLRGAHHRHAGLHGARRWRAATRWTGGPTSTRSAAWATGCSRARWCSRPTARSRC